MVFAGLNFTSYLGLLVGALAVAGVIGGIVGALRTSLQKTTTELYRQDNDALRSRMSTMSEDIVLKDKEIVAKNTTIAERDREIETLRSLVTGASVVDRLSDNMAGHFAIVEALLHHAVGEEVFEAAKKERDEARDRERGLRGLAPEPKRDYT